MKKIVQENEITVTCREVATVTSIKYNGHTYYSRARFLEDNKISERTLYNWMEPRGFKKPAVETISVAGATTFFRLLNDDEL